jgi:hypothetical protein
VPHLSTDFEPFLPASLRDELAQSSSTACGLRPNNSIGFTNAAWGSFADENGAEEAAPWLNSSVLEHFPPPIRRFYEQLFSQVRQSGEPADHRYQCSSPRAYREFAMRVLPLGELHLLIIHHLVVQSAHSSHTCSPNPRYQSETGLVTLCCHCRRTQRADEPTTWDWVPDYLEAASGASHGLCRACYWHYAGEEDPVPSQSPGNTRQRTPSA